MLLKNFLKYFTVTDKMIIIYINDIVYNLDAEINNYSWFVLFYYYLFVWIFIYN